jgi:hypothetical protein
MLVIVTYIRRSSSLWGLVFFYLLKSAFFEVFVGEERRDFTAVVWFFLQKSEKLTHISKHELKDCSHS